MPISLFVYYSVTLAVLGIFLYPRRIAKDMKANPTDNTLLSALDTDHVVFRWKGDKKTIDDPSTTTILT